MRDLGNIWRRSTVAEDVRVARWSFVVVGLALAVVRFLGGTPPERNAEGVLASVAYGLAVAAPGLVAMVARAPVVVAGAGIAGVVVATVASFGITLPLVIPAFAIAAAGLREVGRSHVSPSSAAAAALVTVALPWSVLVLLVHQDPIEWSNGSASDVVVWWEALASLMLTATVTIVARRVHEPVPLLRTPA